ncbi:hypothetical protein GF362_00585 [Candidatus Dojkabacteria bacterium]|nr:hypothetical protein [Candidatus Dojkabacteria bacterium]
MSQSKVKLINIKNLRLSNSPSIEFKKIKLSPNITEIFSTSNFSSLGSYEFFINQNLNGIIIVGETNSNRILAEIPKIEVQKGTKVYRINNILIEDDIFVRKMILKNSGNSYFWLIQEDNIYTEYNIFDFFDKKQKIFIYIYPYTPVENEQLLVRHFLDIEQYIS